MRILRDQLYSAAQFAEHKKIMKFPGARVVDLQETRNGALVSYAINLCDYKFMIMYHDGGHSDLYFLHASYDNIVTLGELLKNFPTLTGGE